MRSSNASDPRGAESVRLVFDGTRLTLGTLDPLLGQSIHVDMSPEVWKRIEGAAERVRIRADDAAPAYGINTGFGHLCRHRIDSSDLAKLQTNLILSHVRWFLMRLSDG
jgi:histidine ammonia-lyase